MDLDWFCLRQDLSDGVPRLFIDTVERTLPEALPRRFGESEPFQGKYAEAGSEGFTAAFNDATSLLFFSGLGRASAAISPLDRVSGSQTLSGRCR